MKVLFTISPWAGHFYPMVPLGWALQAAGHEVRVMCTPSSADWVRGAGLVPAPILDDHDNPLFWARLFHQQRVIRGVARDNGLPLLHPVTGERMASPDEFDWPAYKRKYENEWGQAWLRKMERVIVYTGTFAPDLVVHDMMSAEGPFAAVIHGLPSVLHLWGPVGTAETDPRVDIVPEYNNGILRSLGVKGKGRELITHVIDPCPEAIAPPTAAERLPMRYVPYNGPGEAPVWVYEKPEKRRICVVWGHTLSRFGPEAFLVPKVLEALADLDAEVVVAINPKDREYVGELPANARILEQFPINMLLPTCDAVVHHGGAGSVMSAVVAGVPQLAIPFEEEQHANGQRVAAAGAGIHMLGKEATVERIREHVDALLGDDSYRRGAEKLVAELAERPTPAQLVPVLEEIAAERTPAVTVDWDSIDTTGYDQGLVKR
ncbi:nucleotide disphospho-sugar-binding domain-containing protein [Kitasatospora sp. NPDC101235]|uniref:nucleotide disphospho-sugar-binding domain-containing protein n=1 Tax=Kitasatospora sp. NPDC101235 TaxID=3364101 RepID=UPI003823F30D